MSTQTQKIYGMPDPLAPDAVKKSPEYGLKIAKIIEQEWFGGGMISSTCDFMSRRQWIIDKRMFIRGENDTKTEKDLISRNEGDLEYNNLDWTQLNFAQTPCNIVANGINDENYRLDIRAVDAISVQLRKNVMENHRKNMYAKPMLDKANALLGIDLRPKGFVPEDDEELALKMELDEKPDIEIAEEIMIDFTKRTNDWTFIEQEKNKDLVKIGIAVARVYTDKNDGVKVSYVDPENFGHSFVRKNNFSDAYYFFEVDTLTINDIKRESDFDDKKLREIAKKYSAVNSSFTNYDFATCEMNSILNMKIDVMRFAYKSSKTIIFKKTLNKKGQVLKVSKRDENFNPPEEMGLKAAKTLDTWYEGNYIVGSNEIYGYQECENLVRDEMNKVKPPFIARATDIYKNKLKSFLGDIQPVCRELQREHLKLQQLILELKPDLTEIDLDSLATLEGAKGDSKKETWKTALNLLNVKGVVFKERIDMGEMGIKEGTAARPMGNAQGSAIAPILNAWAHYANQLYKITGITPGNDGSLSADALVGVSEMQKLAGNTATKHIVDSAVDFNKRVCEVISSRIHAIFKFDDNGRLRKMYENAVGKHNLDALEALADRSLHEFGFTVEMIPSQQQMQNFERDLGIALQEGTIDVEDKIQAENIAKSNIKSAYRYLKYRRRKRIKQRMEEQSIMAQEKSQNDIASAQAATESKVKAYGLQKQIDVDAEARLSSIRLNEYYEKKKIDAPGNELEFKQDVYLESMKVQTTMELNKYKEDAKDLRLDRQSTQNSQMIDQRKKDSGPIDFEKPFDFDSMFGN
ncbi:MAG: hypothetical protein H7Y10_03615 [Flavobacterium sp.]|nr:hypothetical protein [Flavobacterium sp.]